MIVLIIYQTLDTYPVIRVYLIEIMSVKEDDKNA